MSQRYLQEYSVPGYKICRLWVSARWVAFETGYFFSINEQGKITSNPAATFETREEAEEAAMLHALLNGTNR